jgi:hypothetical protein
MPATAKGTQETVEFSVMGPGAKLKVYVEPEVPVGLTLADAAQQAVIGGVGGWRGLDESTYKTTGVQQTVTILPYEQVETLFNVLEPTVALSYIPLPWTNRDVLSYTLAYYEHPMGTGQDQLIPVYAMDVQYDLESQETVTSAVYIPSNETYMAPLAKIMTATVVPDQVSVGTELVFEAVDASQNLSDLGYDPSLTFPLGSGDPDSYLYDWYLGSVAPENKLGSGRTLTYTVALETEVHPGSAYSTQSIILQVTDSLSPRPPSTSIDSYELTVEPSIYLPAMVKP